MRIKTKDLGTVTVEGTPTAETTVYKCKHGISSTFVGCCKNTTSRYNVYHLPNNKYVVAISIDNTDIQIVEATLPTLYEHNGIKKLYTKEEYYFYEQDIIDYVNNIEKSVEF